MPVRKVCCPLRMTNSKSMHAVRIRILKAAVWSHATGTLDRPCRQGAAARSDHNGFPNRAPVLCREPHVRRSPDK